MGSWACGSFSNDSALDWIQNNYDDLLRNIVNGLNAQEYEYQRAAAVFLAHCLQLPMFDDAIQYHDEKNNHTPFSENCLFGHAVSVIDQQLADHDWIDSWRDTYEIVLSLNHDRDLVQQAWNTYKRSLI